MIKIVAVLLQSLVTDELSREQIVTTSDFADVTMQSCLMGAPQLAQWMTQHPAERLAAWRCARSASGMLAREQEGGKMHSLISPGHIEADRVPAPDAGHCARSGLWVDRDRELTREPLADLRRLCVRRSLQRVERRDPVARYLRFVPVEPEPGMALGQTFGLHLVDCTRAALREGRGWRTRRAATS